MPLSRGAGSPSNTMSPGPRPTSAPSGIFIHPAVWPQQTWAENWAGGCAPLGGRSPSNTMWQGLRPTLIPRAILIHAAVWPQVHNRHGPKTGGGLLCPFLRGSWVSSCNTMWPGPRPTPVPSGTSIHAAVWPQHVGKIGGAVAPFFRGRGRAGFPSNTVGGVV